MWDGSWSVKADSEPCLRMWFDANRNSAAEIAAAAKLEATESNGTKSRLFFRHHFDEDGEMDIRTEEEEEEEEVAEVRLDFLES